MRSGVHDGLTWSTLMPGSIGRDHESPKTGSSVSAILRAARRPVGARDGFRAIDMDLRAVRRVIGKRVLYISLGLHDETARGNGYTHRLGDDGKLHRLTPQQLGRSLAAWGYDGIRSWRRANGDRVLTYLEAVKLGAQHGVVIVGELKSRVYATVAQASAWLVTCAKRVGHPAWFMALANMWGVGGKATLVHRAGGAFAVIFGKLKLASRRRPRDYDQWRGSVTRLWGRTLGRW